MEQQGRCIGVRLDEAGNRVIVWRKLDRKCVAKGVTAIVFDLNHVLCVKWFDPAMNYTAGIHCHARHGNLAFYIRPGIRKFVHWAIKTLGKDHVWVWTTAQRETALAIVPHISPLIPHENILCADQCVEGEGASPIKDIGRVPRIRAAGSSVIIFDDDIHKYKAEHHPLVKCCPPFDPTSPFDPLCVIDQGVAWMQQNFQEGL
jgi:hypothetical protein